METRQTAGDVAGYGELGTYGGEQAACGEGAMIDGVASCVRRCRCVGVPLSANEYAFANVCAGCLSSRNQLSTVLDMAVAVGGRSGGGGGTSGTCNARSI